MDKIQANDETEDDDLDKALFTVDAEAYKMFQRLATRPLPVTDKLRQLMNTKAPWDD